MKKITGLCCGLMLLANSTVFGAGLQIDNNLDTLLNINNTQRVEYSDWVKVRRALLGQPDKDKEREEAEKRAAELERRNALLEKDLADERAKDKISIVINNVNENENNNINDNDNINNNDNKNENNNSNENNNENDNDNVNDNNNINQNQLVNENTSVIDFYAELDNSNVIDIDNPVTVDLDIVNDVDANAEAEANAAAQAQASAEIDLTQMPGYNPAPKDEIVRGDINCDGKISLKDLSILRMLLSGKVPFNVPLCLQAGDIDKNSIINYKDEQYLKDFLVGNISYDQLQHM